MFKKLILPLSIIALLATQMACNSKSNNYENEYMAATSVQVTAFSLSDNKKVLDSLSHVFFTIDLVKGEIFNADSLPYGTKVTKLVPVITAPSSASTVELTFYNSATRKDSTVNYRTSSTDSIDFTEPVKLRVVSESLENAMIYQVKVNVHKTKPDTLAWSQIDMAQLPSTIGTVEHQRAACLDGTYYCLSSGNGKYCMATTSDIANPQWQTSQLSLSFVPDVDSFNSSDDSLYILGDDGKLYASADGSSWSATAEKWENIYGGYGDQILGCKKDGDAWLIAAYPSAQTWPMPAGFPVKGASQPCVYSPGMAYSSQCILVGGIDASDKLLKSTWGYDGNQWCEISANLPIAVEGATVVDYDLVKVPSSTWTPVKYPATLLFGGRVESGAINRTVYYSVDWGLTWRKAPDLLQLPADVRASRGATAYVETTVMHTSRAYGAWSPIAVKALPAQCAFEYGFGKSRVTEAPTEWDCPAIYMIGGYNYDNEALNVLWRGVILRYTFVPNY